MAAALWQTSTTVPVSIAASTTSFIVIGAGSLDPGATETNLSQILRDPGSFARLLINVLTNDRATSTLTSRKDSAAGAQSVSITGSTTGHFQDVTNVDTVVAGSAYDIQIVTGAGGTVFTYNMISCVFTATTDTVTRLTGKITTTNPTSTDFWRMLGGGAVSGTEANHQYLVPVAGTLKYGYARVSANTRDGASTLKSRVNGADGTIAVSIGSSATGNFEDVTNTDTIAAADKINWGWTLGGSSGTIQLRTMGVSFISTASQWLLGLANSSGVVVAASAVNYLPVEGLIFTAQTTETNASGQANRACTASKLGMYVSANTITGDSTVKLRKNAANGNQSVTITGLTTGHFIDASNSDSVVATDLLALQVTGGALGTSMVVSTVEMLATAADNNFKPLVNGRLVGGTLIRGSFIS